VTASLVDDEIIIAVIWEGECWDMLRDLETYPKRVSGGYVCDECPEVDRPVFSSREGLWCAEVFADISHMPGPTVALAWTVTPRPGV